MMDEDNTQNNNNYYQKQPTSSNFLKPSDLHDKDLTQLCFELINPTYKDIALPYGKQEVVDENGKITGYTDVLMQMFTKELQTANLDRLDYEYCLSSFNLIIMLINHGVIGKVVVSLLEMVNTRLLASNSKRGHLTKHMLSTIVNYKQKVEQTQDKKSNSLLFNK